MNANVARNVPSAIQRCVHVSSLENSAGGSGTNNHVVALGMHPLRFTAPPTASDSLPSARIRGVSATHAVGPDRYPAGQGSHAVDPSAAAKKKSSQGSHVISPASGWIVPAGHGAHTSVPVVDATVPATHISHAVMPLDPAAYPTAQGSHVAASLAAEKRPAGHASHVLAPPGSVEITRVPGGHVDSTAVERTVTPAPTFSVPPTIAASRATMTRVTSATSHVPPRGAGKSAGVLT